MQAQRESCGRSAGLRKSEAEPAPAGSRLPIIRESHPRRSFRGAKADPPACFGIFRSRQAFCAFSPPRSAGSFLRFFCAIAAFSQSRYIPKRMIPSAYLSSFSFFKIEGAPSEADRSVLLSTVLLAQLFFIFLCRFSMKRYLLLYYNVSAKQGITLFIFQKPNAGER